MGQGDHSKQNIITIKIPNPIVTFLHFQNEGDLRKKFQKEIQEVIWGASKVELPPDYWLNVRKLFTFWDKSYSIMSENILKYTSTAELEDVKNYFSQLETHADTIKKSFEQLLQDGISVEDRTTSTTYGLTAGQEILRCFADKDGILAKKSIQTSPFLITFAAIYKTFSKMWGNDESKQRKEMERLEDTLVFYQNSCIKERLDNIKMLRTQTESFNVHDYSYEAQVRKDVAFGGQVNDFYDKRTADQITFSDNPLVDPTDADKILAGYKDAVKMEYELFFNLVLNGNPSG